MKTPARIKISKILIYKNLKEIMENYKNLPANKETLLLGIGNEFIKLIIKEIGYKIPNNQINVFFKKIIKVIEHQNGYQP